MSVDRLRKAFDKAVQAAEKRSDVLGRLGKVEPGGSVTLMADRPGHVHVRLGPEGTLGQSTAKNAANVPLRAHLPVRMRRVNGVLVIIGLDYEGGRLEAAIANDTSNVFGLTRHHHRIGSGMEYEVEALLLEPGRVRPHSGLSVWINPFFYNTAAGRAFWPGGALDLTPYKPSAGQWAWALVGIDPATNGPVAATGTEVGSSDLLTTMMLADIDLGDALPCGGVKVSGDDTAITSIARFADAREWLNRGGGGGGALSSLSDVDLTGLADNDLLQYDAGSSTWKPVAPAGASQTFYAVQIDDQTPVTEGLDGTNNSNSSYAYIDETLSIPVPFEATDFLIDIFRADTYTLTITRAGVQLASIQAVVASDSTNDVSFTPAQPVVLSGLCTFRLTGTAVRQMRYNDGGTALHSYFSLLGLSFGGVTSGTTWHLPMKIELNPGMWTEITT